MNGARTGEPGRRRPQNERRSYSKWPSPTTRQLSHGSVPEPAMEKGARAEGERERPGRPRSGEHVAGMRTRHLAARFHTHHRRFAHADAHAAASHGRDVRKFGRGCEEATLRLAFVGKVRLNLFLTTSVHPR